MGGSVCLYWIGNVMRSSRNLIAEDVRHLGYDIVQIGKDLSTFRRIAVFTFKVKRSAKKPPSAVLVLLVFDCEGHRIFRNVCLYLSVETV